MAGVVVLSCGSQSVVERSAPQGQALAHHTEPAAIVVNAGLVLTHPWL